MTRTAADSFYFNAIALRDRIMAGQTNETLVQAWASVCRECAKANDARRRELADKAAYGYAENQWFVRLDRVWWHAKAQVETLARRAA